MGCTSARVRIGVVLAVAALVAAAVPAAQASIPRCEFSAADGRLFAVGDPNELTISRGTATEIVVSTRAVGRPPTFGGQKLVCEDGGVSATVENVDTITVPDTTALELHPAGLAPGATDEAGADEIEVRLEGNLGLRGTGPGAVEVVDDRPAHQRALGALPTGWGANLNAGEESGADADVDLFATPRVAEVGLFGDPETEVVDARGGPLFTGPLPAALRSDGSRAGTIAFGGAGPNELRGSDAADLLVGGPANDYLSDFAGDDLVAGGAGDDFVSDYEGDDAFAGGQGDDVVTTAMSPTFDGALTEPGIELDLGKEGPQRVSGVAGVDTLRSFEGAYGTHRGDVIRGNASGNTIFGGGGDDLIDGRGGADRLLGEDRADRLIGSGGRDVLLGGVGIDDLDARDGRADRRIDCQAPRSTPERVSADGVDPRPRHCGVGER